MGNTYSHSHLDSPTVSLTKPHKPRLARKLSCITAWSSQESLPSSSSSTIDEKHIRDRLLKHDDHHADEKSELNAAFTAFLDLYPEYQQTWTIDSLRRSDYSRLVRNDETYVDYMGGALFPESLVQIHSDFLSRNIMGNTHSVSNRSVTYFPLLLR